VWDFWAPSAGNGELRLQDFVSNIKEGGTIKEDLAPVLVAMLLSRTPDPGKYDSAEPPNLPATLPSVSLIWVAFH